ncbi:hypothetical protein, partial [Xanthomonas translucens]
MKNAPSVRWQTPQLSAKRTTVDEAQTPVVAVRMHYTFQNQILGTWHGYCYDICAGGLPRRPGELPMIRRSALAFSLAIATA